MKSPIAWCTSAGPAEYSGHWASKFIFLKIMAHYWAHLGQRKNIFPEPIRKGYDGEICSYLTADIGALAYEGNPL
jgi:hypothetical protein